MAEELAYVLVNPYTLFKSRTGGVLARLMSRTALDLAYNKPETRGIIDAALGGRALDTKTMAPSAVRVLFNTVAAQVASTNNSRAVDGTIRQVNGGGLQTSSKLTSLASINERNKERYGRKSA